MESAATTEQQGPRLQQVRICSNTATISAEIKEGSYLPSEGLKHTGISSKKFSLLQPTLRRRLEGGVDPGSTPSGQSGHCMHLSLLGPAFPPGAPSLLQAVTQHFHYTLRNRFQPQKLESFISVTMTCSCSCFVTGSTDVQEEKNKEYSD